MKGFIFGFITCLALLNVYNVALAQQGFEQYQFSNGLQGQSIKLPGGVRQYHFSDGTTGQSIDLPGGVRQYNFSDGTQGQRLQRPNMMPSIDIGIQQW